MRNDELPKFLELMSGIGEYYGRQLSETILGVYWDGLRKYDLPDVKRAVHLHMANPDSGQFFPKLADISRHIGGGNADRALVAWAKVDKAVRTVGPNRSVVFDDAAIHAVIQDMGGWTGFVQCDLNEWPFRQNEFVKRYRGYLERGDAGAYPAKLIGIADMHNRQLGIDNHRETALIGETDKCLTVMSQGSEASEKVLVSSLSDLSAVKRVEKHEAN